MPKKKKKGLCRSTTFLLWVLLVLGCHSAGTSIITIETQSGSALKVAAEVADTEEKRSRGLMFRRKLPEGAGMLFIFPSETQNPFWMKDTPIPLDMIFIKDRRIVDLIENATPYSIKLLIPKLTYEKVLEVPGGYATRHSLHVGDLIESR